jgi:hypothetical protein
VAKYKRKLTILSALCAALLAAYILTFVFAPENRAERRALWTALEPKLKDSVREIRLDGEERVVLADSGGRWFVSFEDALYPALQDRVDGMLDTLSTRGSYPVRSRSEAARDNLLLTEDAARRIVASGSDGGILLDLLIGAPDATGKNVYIKTAGNRDIRSGSDVFSPFLSGRLSWLDLRLFPGDDGNGLAASSVQRVTVQPPSETSGNADTAEQSAPTEAYTLSRNDGGWLLEGSDEAADTQSVESYIRRVINGRAYDFTSALGANDPEFTDPAAPGGRIALELGDGTRRIVTMGPMFMDKYSAAVSGSRYVYLLMKWQADQLFERRDSFMAR